MLLSYASPRLLSHQAVRTFDVAVDAFMGRLEELQPLLLRLLTSIDAGTTPPEQLAKFVRLLDTALPAMKVCWCGEGLLLSPLLGSCSLH